MRRIGISLVQQSSWSIVSLVVLFECPHSSVNRGRARMVSSLLEMRNQGPKGKVTQQVHGNAGIRA